MRRAPFIWLVAIASRIFPTHGRPDSVSQTTAGLAQDSLAVSQPMQREVTTARWLLYQEEAILNAAGCATKKLENRHKAALESKCLRGSGPAFTQGLLRADTQRPRARERSASAAHPSPFAHAPGCPSSGRVDRCTASGPRTHSPGAELPSFVWLCIRLRNSRKFPANLRPA